MDWIGMDAGSVGTLQTYIERFWVRGGLKLIGLHIKGYPRQIQYALGCFWQGMYFTHGGKGWGAGAQTNV